MKRFLSLAPTVCALVASLVACAALAQEYGVRREQPQVQREALRCSGTVKELGRGVFQLTTEEGEQWLVQVQARPQDIAFTGTADAAFVKPGMWVRFQTKLSKRGEAPEPIDTLEIFTPREGYGTGVTAEVGGGNASELFGDKPEAASKPKKTDENTTYLVAGQISKISRLGEMTINAAGTTVKAKLDDEAKVRLDVADLSYLRPGDKVEMRGWYPAGQKGRAIAEQVTASASEPLSGETKKKKPVANTEKPDEEKSEKPASDEEKKEKAVEGEKKDKEE